MGWWVKSACILGAGMAVAGYESSRRPVNPDPARLWMPSDMLYHPRTQVLKELVAFVAQMFSLKSSSPAVMRQRVQVFQDATGQEPDGAAAEFTAGIALQAELMSQMPTVLGTLVQDFKLKKGIDYRNELLQHVDAHPEVRLQQIEKPLVIVGMPRTGTTLLYTLLNLDKRARAPRLEELVNPGPPYRSDELDHIHQMKSYQAMVREMQLRDFLFPGWWALLTKHHPMALDAPEEEYFLLEHGGIDMIHPEFLRDRRFREWMADAESKRAHYRLLKRFLQSRQAVYRPSSHWLLKAPLHMLYMPRLMEEFPDARIIQTERPLLFVLSSYLELMKTAQIGLGLSPRYEIKELVEANLHMINLMLQRFSEYCAAHPELPVYRVNFEALVKDPVGTVEHIYREFGYEMTPEYHQALVDWVAAHHTNRAQRGSGDAVRTLQQNGVTQELVERYPHVSAQWGSTKLSAA